MEPGVSLPLVQGQCINAAVMVTSGVGFNARMGDDPDHTLSLIRRDLQLMREICQRFEGQVLKEIGHDGLMLYFMDSAQAIGSAIEVQKSLAYMAASPSGVDVLPHRIGVHFGEIVFDAADATGNGVRVAIRLQEEAAPRGVCMSQTVYDAVKGQLSLEATYLGSLSFRNVQEAVQAYQIFPATQLSGGIAAPTSSEDELAPGTLVNNRYRVETVLGRGGFGKTYLAADTHCFGDFCVLKEFLPASKADYIVQKSRELFEREARVLYQINHPQIPRFLAWLGDRGRLFLVQEYIDGKTYAALIQERRQKGEPAFSEAEVIEWLKELLPVLDYLHSLNILHRDISPENIMLPNGQCKPVLIDFGLVKQTVSQIMAAHNVSRSVTQASMVGKFGYSPPEQIRMGQCYPCSDLYALGVSAIVLLTGMDLNLLIDHESLEWQWRSYAKVSDAFAHVLTRMLVEKPRDRYQSALELLAELRRMAPRSDSANQGAIDITIEIDQDKRCREVSDIVETSYFRELAQQAESLRDDFFDPEYSQINTGPDRPQTNEFTGQSFFSGFVPATAHPESTQSGELASIDATLLDICRQELTRFIGPMAGLIIKNVLTQHPQMSREQLVEALAARIPGFQQAQAFTNSVRTIEGRSETGTSGQLTNPPNSSSKAVEPTIARAPGSTPRSTGLPPEFLDACRRELARCIGPIAKFMVQDVVKRQPQITAQQLIDALATTIPNPQQAETFKQQLSKLV